MDNEPIAAYLDLPANMLGVQLDRTPVIPTPTATPTATTTSDPDWAQLAEEAIHNADLGKADPLPLAPELIIVDDEDDTTPLLLAVKKCFLLFPRLNRTCYLPHKLLPSLCHHLKIIDILPAIAPCQLT